MALQFLDKPKVVKATRELAIKFRDMERCPNERPLSKKKLLVYEPIMRSGYFRPCSWASAYCKEEDTVYRVNGQHTSYILSHIKDPFPDVYAVIEEYHCDSRKDLASLYQTFDTVGQVRNSGDLYMVYAGAYPELACIVRREIKNLVSAFALIQYGGSLFTEPATSKAVFFESEVNRRFMLWYHDFIKSGAKHGIQKKLMRFPITAAMFKTWQINEVVAERFWTNVRDLVGENADSVCLRFSKLVMDFTMKTGLTKKNSLSDHRWYSEAAFHWNAYRRKTDNVQKYRVKVDKETGKPAKLNYNLKFV